MEYVELFKAVAEPLCWLVVMAVTAVVGYYARNRMKDGALRDALLELADAAHVAVREQYQLRGADAKRTDEGKLLDTEAFEMKERATGSALRRLSPRSRALLESHAEKEPPGPDEPSFASLGQLADAEIEAAVHGLKLEIPRPFRRSPPAS